MSIDGVRGDKAAWESTEVQLIEGEPIDISFGKGKNNSFEATSKLVRIERCTF